MIDIKTIIGIDPGASGGIAVWRIIRDCSVNGLTAQITTVKMPKEFRDMVEYLKNTADINPGHTIAFIEKVQVRPDDTGGKQYGIAKMLANYGSLKNALEQAGIPYIMVHPMSWQSYLNLRTTGESKTERKNRYKEVAQKHYPIIKCNLWNSDALLMVSFGIKKINNDQAWIEANLPARSLELFER
ncbi:MAG: hypothetical protein ACOYMF_06115 [Bacteroidales bacterium]